MSNLLATILLAASEGTLSSKKGVTAETKLAHRTVSFLAMCYLAFNLTPNEGLRGMMVAATVVFYLASAIEYFRNRKGRATCSKS